LRGSETSQAVLATKPSRKRRRLSEFPDASAECVKAADDTTKELVEACLEPPNERVSSVGTIDVTDDEEVLIFFQNVTIESDVASGSFDDLSECINKSVMDNNATDTLRSNAEKSGCFELEEGTVEDLTFVTEADAPTVSPSSPDKPSDVSSSPTVSPSSPDEPSDVSSSPPLLLPAVQAIHPAYLLLPLLLLAV